MLDVLVYNIEYSGGRATDAVIRSLDADVVGVLESYNRLPTIARKTGYDYYNVGLQLLSKYPIHEPSGAEGLYALIEVQPGYVVAFFNTHLDYVKYGPRLLKSGTAVDAVIASENEVRTSSILKQTPDMVRLADEGYPVFLTGDFNEPSSLDYTASGVETRDFVSEPVPWPVSQTLLDLGLRDTYREIHPDPVVDPGVTTAKREGGDRIDYVYAGGPTTTVSSQLIGEPGGVGVDVEFDPWTSDHRAVLSTVEVTPIAVPTMVALDRRMLTEDEPLLVTYNDGSDDNGTVTVAAVEAAAAPVLTLPAPGPSGQLTIDTGALAPAGYEVVLLDEAGAELARNEFWVRSADATVSISTGRASYDVGEPIEVSWVDGPANRWDWIGVYKADKSNPEKDYYLLWGYTGLHDSGALPPTVAGAMVLDESSQGKPWPLPPGKYVVHYLLTDEYTSAGSTPFRVKG